MAAFLTPVVAGRIQFDTFPTPPSLQAGFIAIVQGAAAPTLSLLLIALPITLALFLMRESRVQGFAKVCLVFLGLILAASVTWSAFQFDSFVAVLPWMVAGIALVAGSSDRRSTLMLGLFAGCTLIALLGIHEYMLKVRVNPSWRIFSLWFNPNALASILGLGIWVACDVYQQSKQKVRPFVILGGLAIFAAFLLTQSKGAFAVIGISVIIFIFAGIASRRARAMQTVGVLAAAGIAVLAVYGLGKIAESRGAQPAMFTRVTASDAESTQSIAYRKELAMGAIQLVEMQPWGHGMGTYRHIGTRPGRTIPAQQTHNSWLQLAVEASIAAPVILLLCVAAMLIASVRRAFEPVAHLVAGAAFIGLHGAIESNLFVGGTLVSFGMVLGAISCRTDSEALSRARLIPWFGVLVCLALAYAGTAELMQSRTRGYLLVDGHPEKLCAQMTRIWPWEPESWSLSADAAHDIPEKRQFAENALALAPNVSNALLLASVCRAHKDYFAERRACLVGLSADPNEPDILLGLMDNRSNSKAETRKWAERLVALETSAYLQITPLPDLVQTQPAVARLKLAEMGVGDVKAHLISAMDRLQSYARRTIPRVVAAYEGGDFSGYAGEDGSRALPSLALGLLAAKRAQATGNRDLADRAKACETIVRAAEAQLRTVLQFKPLKV